MGRSRKNKPLYEAVEITDIGAEGKAIARVNDMVVFTTHVVPGDIVDLQVTKKRKSYMEARVTNIREKSADRQEAFCAHFGTCGGCKWQFLPYEKQLYYKQKQVADQLRRLGRIELPAISPILGSAKNTFYRNKLEFSFSNKRWRSFEEMDTDAEHLEMNALGFHIPGLFDKIIDIEKCWLQPEPSNAVRNFIREYALKNKLSFFDIRQQEGFLRNMIVRTASTGENMLIVVFFYEDLEKQNGLLEAIAAQFPELTSIMYVINQKPNDTISDQEIIPFKGPDHIFEEMEGLRFKIGPKSFYQTNSEQAYELYKVTRDFAELKGDEVVYDLYTGTGTIANFVAKKAKQVIGIEYVPEAIEDAKVNSGINELGNTLFYAGDMKNVLNEAFIAQHGKPDVIITDPPRAGMHEDVVKTILAAAPERIVYVSCNPATQARDLALLDVDYKVTKIQPVDMFPHTHHVENVVQLIRKNR
ncbi:23S rRNA (uracil(1939)-C(5))-methyltransferase RlmD [Mangrovibacterium diazotrophicum]|uniref:23S rRNA (uracil(1939)-C(5))-methyltransferase RlmD n=1 Tax=Mangrovibacterium diazotrophicum TaxID=1261403 RepID=UPI000E75E31C|nr:23S rRNA (uracil(1939)-C(5))-methyltransferase RlmD [Mangrovibacterium diazotrophicum]